MLFVWDSPSDYIIPTHTPLNNTHPTQQHTPHATQIIMGTFVLSFIGNGFVTSAQSWPVFGWFTSKSKRRLLVIVYFSALISLVTLFGVMTIPDIVREGADFVERLQNDNIWVVVLKKMRNGLGDGVMDSLERFVLLASSDDIVHMAAEVQVLFVFLGGGAVGGTRHR